MEETHYGIVKSKPTLPPRDLLPVISYNGRELDVAVFGPGVYTKTEITNEKELKKMLNGVKEVNGIYLIDDKVGFAPYESFNQGVQDVDTFAESGLARVLEHTEDKTAKNLREVASQKNYPRGVNVFRFGNVEEPISRVVGLYSNRYVSNVWFGVDGDVWDGGNGCAF